MNFHNALSLAPICQVVSSLIAQLKEFSELSKATFAAMKTPPPRGYYVWDGIDEDDRPATPAELQAALTAGRKNRQTTNNMAQEQVAICLDHEILTAFRSTGTNWQSYINDALRDWLKQHPVGRY